MKYLHYDYTQILTDEDKLAQYENSKNPYSNYRGGNFGILASLTLLSTLLTTYTGFNFFFQNKKPILSETFSLTYENFDTMVTDEDVWVIEFYAGIVFDLPLFFILFIVSFRQMRSLYGIFSHLGKNRYAII